MKLFSSISSRTRLRAAGPRISQGYLRTAQKVEKPTRARSSIRRGPGKSWDRKPWLIVRRDKKEVLNLSHPAGFAEYRWRILMMLVRQDGICCDCLGPLTWEESTFEHEDGRGACRRDDRIALFDDEGRFLKHI